MRKYPFDGAPPADQQTYSTVRDLIRAAFVLCDVSRSYWNLPETYTDDTPCDLTADANTLRGFFLDCLEFALDSGAEHDSLWEDFGEERQGLEWGRETSDEWVRVEWEFAGRDEGGRWLFNLTCTQEDMSSIWLDGDFSANGTYGMDDVKADIAEARDALEGGC